jgi:hypothetical protein
MKKTNVLWIILDLIFLVIFNVLFFVIGGTEHNTAVWMSYAFIHFAYFMLLITPALIRKGKSTAVFGFSLYSISAAYFFTGFITGIIFILVSPESYTAALSVQLCIVGLYGIILISNMLANERTASAEEKRQYQIAYVKEASTKLKGLIKSVNDKEVKKKVERVYATVYSSPVKSHPSLTEIENRMLQSINELEDAISTENKEKIILLTNSLLTTINERNNQLKTLN